MLCTVRTFSFKNKACNPICKALRTIYEHYIDKKVKGDIKHCFWCKLSVFVCLAIYNICYKLLGFYLLLNLLTDTSKGILYHFRTDF